MYRQAEEYRHAKKILSDELSGTDEKTKAVTTLERLWNEDYAIAAHQLGKVYRDGLTGNVNVNRAVDWFRRSAEAGNDFSAYALGKLLLESGNTAEALRFMKQAAEAGHQYAQYALGKLYLLGRYWRRDRTQASHWFILAAAHGNIYAQHFLDHMGDAPGAHAGTAVLRMLHHMGNIFRDNCTADKVHAGMQADKKLRRKIKQKRIALGQKADDHEQEQKYIMKQ